jgi:hypothetical protein
MVIGMGKGQQSQQDKPVFQLEPDDSPIQSEIGVPKGTAAEDGDYHVFTSEDGSLTVKVPRTDLVNPSVQDTYAGGVYTYVVANSATAKQAIKIVRIVPNTKTVTEVSTDPRFKFIGIGWASTEEGIKPGESATFQIKADGMKVTRVPMQFENVPNEVIELPPTLPYGLKVLMRNHIRDHFSASVMVVGPR